MKIKLQISIFLYLHYPHMLLSIYIDREFTVHIHIYNVYYLSLLVNNSLLKYYVNIKLTFYITIII